MGLYFLCSKNIGADQLRSLILQNCKRQFCQDAVLSYTGTRFVLISSFDYAKGVNVTLWLVGISDRKCVRLVSCIDIIINFMTLRCQNKMRRAIRKPAVCLDVKIKAQIRQLHRNCPVYQRFGFRFIYHYFIFPLLSKSEISSL